MRMCRCEHSNLRPQNQHPRNGNNGNNRTNRRHNKQYRWVIIIFWFGFGRKFYSRTNLILSLLWIFIFTFTRHDFLTIEIKNFWKKSFYISENVYGSSKLDSTLSARPSVKIKYTRIPFRLYIQGETRSGPILSVSETICSGGLEKETILMGSGRTARRNRRLYKLYGDSLFIIPLIWGPYGDSWPI